MKIINGIEVYETKYPGYYVSKCGEIYSDKAKSWKTKTPNKGYYSTQFFNRKTKKSKSVCIHRLVANKFIPNPENKPFVNHKNGNKLDNCVDNLEWCTRSENAVHAYKIGLNKKRTKSVCQLDLDGNVINIFDSIREAESITGVGHSNISSVCLGRKITAGGFRWKYEDDTQWRPSKKFRNTIIKKMDLDMNLVQTFLSLAKAAESVGGYPTPLKKATKSGKIYREYFWKVEDNKIRPEEKLPLPKNWVVVYGNPEYLISKKGKFYSTKTNKYLKTTFDASGYEKIVLNGKTFSVHRLVLLSYTGPSFKKHVNHINGKKYDNSIDNLEWCTASENVSHAHSTGLIKKKRSKCIIYNDGERTPLSFESITLASKFFQISQTTLRKYCREGRKFKNGYFCFN